jgi:hypothetical protein
LINVKLGKRKLRGPKVETDEHAWSSPATSQLGKMGCV